MAYNSNFSRDFIYPSNNINFEHELPIFSYMIPYNLAEDMWRQDCYIRNLEQVHNFHLSMELLENSNRLIGSKESLSEYSLSHPPRSHCNTTEFTQTCKSNESKYDSQDSSSLGVLEEYRSCINNILLIQKEHAKKRLNEMEKVLSSATTPDFTKIPFSSDQYCDVDPETYDHPLWFAYMNYRSDLVIMMLKKKYHPDEVETFYQGRTLLQLAAYRHDIKMCKILISHGADINKVNRQNNTPLDYLDVIKEMSSKDKKELTKNFSKKDIKNLKFSLKLHYKKIHRI
jgi:hypothetical protein